MKLACVIFALGLWIVANADESGLTLQRVAAGIDAGQGIFNALQATSSSEAFHKIALISGKIAPFLGAIGPAVSLISLFFPSAQTKFIKKEFRLLNSKIDRVFYELGEVQYLIEESSLKLEYSSYEHTIMSLSSKLDDYLNANANNAQTFKRIFANEYKYSFNGATEKLYNGMMKNSNVFSRDIPYTAMKYTNYHRLRTQNIMKGTLNLIIQGVKVTLAYYKAEGISDSDYKALSNVWDAKISRLIDHITRKDNEVKSAWRNQLDIDVDSKLKQLSGRSHKDFSNNLYDFLSEKYDWRYWFVVAYNPIGGWDKHTVKYCGGFHRFRQNGRNMGVASVEKSKRVENYSTTISRLTVNNACTYITPSYFSGGFFICKEASRIYNEIESVVRKGCSPYASFGVIKNGNGLSTKGAPGRLVLNYAGKATIFAFS